MANKLILKKSSVAAKIPLATDLEVGEIAVNLTDQKLYSKQADGTVILVGSGLGGAGDVIGPSSATDGAVALFDGTSGKAIKNGQAPGTIYTQNSNNVSITGGSIAGITDLAVADGGTGASTASGARTNLGLGTAATTDATDYATAAQGDLADTALQPADVGTIASQNSNDVSITGGSITGITDIAVADGGTGSSTAAGARTNLGLGSIATQASNNVSITGGSITGITDLAIADGGTGASTAAAARTNLGLGTAATTDSTDYATSAQGDLADTALQPADVGTIASQNSDDVSITGGSISGITDLAVADGGTGASTAAEALTNLGAYPATNPDGYTTNTGTVTSVGGTGTVNGISLSGTVTTSGDLTLGGTLSDVNLKTQITGTLPIANGGTNATTAETARTNLGLGTAATTDATDYATAAQGDLADTALQPADVGTIASQNANNVSITGGSISGITDLALADGGTGASDAAGARSNLGLGSISTQDSNNVSITGGTVNPGTLQQGGSQAYVRVNILGTVSQSGGVPTGAIIERGSNANGEYVKYADGTLICNGALDERGTIGDQSVRTGDVTLPATFATVVGAFFFFGRDLSESGSSANQVAINYVRFVTQARWGIRNESGLTRGYAITSFFAIGRWY